jgi:hypothetical protein
MEGGTDTAATASFLTVRALSAVNGTAASAVGEAGAEDSEDRDDSSVANAPADTCIPGADSYGSADAYVRNRKENMHGIIGIVTNYRQHRQLQRSTEIRRHPYTSVSILIINNDTVT